MSNSHSWKKWLQLTVLNYLFFFKSNRDNNHDVCYYQIIILYMISVLHVESLVQSQNLYMFHHSIICDGNLDSTYRSTICNSPSFALREMREREAFSKLLPSRNLIVSFHQKGLIVHFSLQMWKRCMRIWSFNCVKSHPTPKTLINTKDMQLRNILSKTTHYSELLIARPANGKGNI